MLIPGTAAIQAHLNSILTTICDSGGIGRCRTPGLGLSRHLVVLVFDVPRERALRFAAKHGGGDGAPLRASLDIKSELSSKHCHLHEAGTSS